MLRKTMLGLVAALTIPLASPAWAQSAATRPTIVLEHGAFADGSTWDKVAAQLRADRYTVLVAANPLRSVASDSASLAAFLRTIKGPIVLVGHSYGGTVITNAGKAGGDVEALVYVAAMAPDKGESVAELANKFPGSQLVSAAVPAPLGDGNVDLYIRADKYRALLAADVDGPLATRMAAAQRPAAQATLVGASGDPAWKDIASYFIYGGADLSMPPALHAFLAKRADAQATIVIKGGSHALPVSHPREVVSLIEQAANAPRAVSPN